MVNLWLYRPLGYPVMTTVTWLHLSDWHHRDMSLDRKVMRDKLVKDISNRAVINDKLKKIDFILFSGDISFSGAKKEFDDARDELIAPIRKIIGEDTPVYCVPGNHDMERSRIANISPELRSTIARIRSKQDWQDFNDTMARPDTAAQLNKPLTNYFDFVEAVKGASDRSKLYSVERIERDGFTIGLVCINTAWNSARFAIQHADKGAAASVDPWVWDYGLLRITETQMQNAFSELGKVDLGILMMHHPLHWIDEFERAKLEQTLFDNCHIVIHGHEHRPNTSRISSAFGDLVFIPAGATYVGRSAEDSQYTNAYNFCVVDTGNFSGTVYHRIWLEVRGRWQADDRFWSEGQSQFILARTKDYDLKLAHKSIVNSSKQYIRYVHMRGALEHNVTIRHDAENVDGEAFIRVRVKIRIKLRAGLPEELFWMTGVDEMIVNHPTKRCAGEPISCSTSSRSWTR